LRQRASEATGLVAVDASWTQLGVSGVGRTLLELLPRLAERTPLVALVDARRPVPDLGPHVAVQPVGVAPGLPRLAWLELGVAPWLARHGDVLLHGAAYALPLRVRAPAVVTLYDVAWETHPRDFRPWKRGAWRLSARRSVATAGAVLTVSDFSRQAIVASYGLDPATVLVAPCAAGAAFTSGPPPPQPGLSLPARYVVALGGAARRDLPLAVEVWRQARAVLGSGEAAPRAALWGGGATPEVELVVVGSERPPEEPGITWLGRVEDPVWASVLAGAEAFLYPTSHEGFGLPAVEACACGTPVVCARVGSLPEVLGDAAAWAPGLDAGSLASALAGLLADPSQRAALSAASLARRAQAPTWDDAADTTVRAYELARRRWGAGR